MGQSLEKTPIAYLVGEKPPQWGQLSSCMWGLLSFVGCGCATSTCSDSAESGKLKYTGVPIPGVWPRFYQPGP